MATYTFSQLQQYAQNAGFDANNAAVLAAIGLAESGGNSLAHNPGTKADPENSYGVFQLNLLAHPDISIAQASDPQQAAQKAYQLWKQSGSTFADWTTYTSGAYRAFLPSGFPNPIQGASQAAGVITADAISQGFKGFFSGIPALNNFLTAPADLGTRMVGTAVGLVIIVIGLISVSVTTNRKILNSALGQSATQGTAQGVATGVTLAAATDGASEAAPKASVSEEPPPQSSPYSYRPRFAPPPPPRARINQATQPANTVIRLHGQSERARAASEARKPISERRQLPRKNPAQGSQTTLDPGVGTDRRPEL